MVMMMKRTSEEMKRTRKEMKTTMTMNDDYIGKANESSSTLDYDINLSIYQSIHTNRR